jgi:hypothetical protein
VRTIAKRPWLPSNAVTRSLWRAPPWAPVYWARDEQTAERLKRAPDYQGEVIYTLAELQELAGQSPELLRDIHRLKRGFGATLEKVNQGVNANSVNTVRCGDCQHFQRIDYPHTGRCAQEHGRHWLWDTDRRECEDFEAAVEGRRCSSLLLLLLGCRSRPGGLPPGLDTWV